MRYTSSICGLHPIKSRESNFLAGIAFLVIFMAAQFPLPEFEK